MSDHPPSFIVIASEMLKENAREQKLCLSPCIDTSGRFALAQALEISLRIVEDDTVTTGPDPSSGSSSDNLGMIIGTSLLELAFFVVSFFTSL